MHPRHPLIILTALCLLLLAGGARAQAAAPPACPPAIKQLDESEAATAQARAPNLGLMWRASRDGRTSYLFGTLHVGKPEWLYPGPALRAAFEATDTLALELDVTDPQVLQGLREAMAAMPALALKPAMRKRLEQQVSAACLPAQALAGLHPVMQVVTLTLLAARWEQLDARFGQEMALAEQARAHGKAVVSLETARDQMQALIPSDAAAGLAMMEDALEQLESNTVRPMLRRMARGWSEGDLADLQAFESWCQCARTPAERAALRRLNDERNPAMAERFEALHAQGKQVLVAVGALHMTGAQGLPRLLAQRGFQLERVAP